MLCVENIENTGKSNRSDAEYSTYDKLTLNTNKRLFCDCCIILLLSIDLETSLWQYEYYIRGTRRYKRTDYKSPGTSSLQLLYCALNQFNSIVI